MTRLPKAPAVASRSMRLWPVLVLLVLTGCFKRLPDAQTPPTTAPTVEAAPPEEGKGRLVIDVTQGSSEVYRVSMVPTPVAQPDGSETYQFTEQPELLCPQSPCFLDIEPGNVLLGFPVMGDPSDLEVELIHVGGATSVYRRTLSEYDGSTGAGTVLGILGATFGSASMITGIALLPVGLSDGDEAMSIAGAITLGAGALLLGLGIWALNLDAKTFRNGAAIHFPLDATTAN